MVEKTGIIRDEEELNLYVAVYGTLKKGYENYDAYLSGYEPVRVEVLEQPYEMFGSREYPMLVPSGRLHAVSLEIFDVGNEKLAQLDALEAPYHYERRAIRVQGLDGDVGLYVHPAPPPSDFVRIPSGNWSREHF